MNPEGINYEDIDVVRSYDQGSEAMGTDVLAGLLHIHTGKPLKVSPLVSTVHPACCERATKAIKPYFFVWGVRHFQVHDWGVTVRSLRE